jgi:protein-S-isoprenylcysteine O-methyltransferase Ste14
MAKDKVFSISPAIMIRDRDLYRKIVRRISFEEKLVLLDFSGDYRVYQRNLHKLARRRGIEIPPAR